MSAFLDPAALMRIKSLELRPKALGASMTNE
jgi:hypothetical protein